MLFFESLYALLLDLQLYMCKKRILFINESLACAGGEKSLLNLLHCINYNKFEVDLQLFQYGNPWEKLIPGEVCILPQLPYDKFISLGPIQRVFYSILHNKYKWLLASIKYSLSLRKRKDIYNIEKSVLYWKYQADCYDKIDKEYDYIVAYAQGIPTFYVADKAPTNAKTLAWINVTYEPKPDLKPFIEAKYKNFNVINCVSETIRDLEESCFPSFKGRTTVLMDILNSNLIHKLSDEPTDITKDTNVLTIVTLGRLTHQKGYDIAIDAAKRLRDRGRRFKWYILGVGPLHDEIASSISRADLDDQVILLGLKPNPYPYLKLADIYVQPSRHEGYGIAIAEARCMNIPIVATNFNCVGVQLTNELNGLVVDMNGNSLSDGIMRLYQDKQLYTTIQSNLKQEQKGTTAIVNQFYNVLSNLV